MIDRTHRWGRRVLPLVLVVAGLVAQGDGAGAESRAGAHADTADKPAQVTPDPAFYTPPSPLPSGTPGTVIRSRPARAGWPSIQAIADAWTVMYLSTDAVDRPVAVTGTILVPKGGTPATRPIIGFGPGTQGPAFRCAPSIQIDAGGFYEQPAVNDMLKKGYAVAVPDYEGYHQNPTSTYMVGKSMGHALIDAVRAAQRFPAGGLSATTPVVFRGYSQGGGAAMWAGELKPSYAPEMNLVGVAGGGVPANLALVGLPLEGADGFGFFFYALLGLDNAYDELSLAPHLNDQGRTEVARMGTEVCALELILDYNGHRLGDYTATNPLTTPWFTRLNENVLGATAITVPVFQYHEPQDGLVAFGQAQTLRNDYCAKGVNHTWKTYDTQGASGIIRHLNLVYRANVDVNAFIAARIAGTPAFFNGGFLTNFVGVSTPSAVEHRAPAWVLHVDLDEFLAAVEIARRPELKGRPVVVGGAGDPTLRAVVATASYEARAFGVRSGMPLRTAARLCPDAVFLPSDQPAYDAVSEHVMTTLRTLPVVVEVLGWDEAFLGASTTHPEVLAAEVQRTVKDETGLSCSVGIGDTRLRAKVATGFAKPAGIYRLTRHNWVSVMGDRPTDALWGVGAKTSRKLTEMGITTVLQLAKADPVVLAARFGPTMGPWYRMLAFGGGDAKVSGDPYVPRSRSREVTFQRNVTDPDELDEQLVQLAKRVAEDIEEEGRPAVRVAVKVRYAPFFTQTRSVPLPEPTGDPVAIKVAARAALARFELGRPVRLLGVRADFTPTSGRG